jgi:hypothetical protein
MRRSFRLALALFLALLGTSAVQAVPLHLCQSGQTTAYYVLWGRFGWPMPVQVDTHSGSVPGPHEIDELEFQPSAVSPNVEPILHILCSGSEEQQFLTQQNLAVGGPLGGMATSELFAVNDTTTGWMVGTAWRDTLWPFDQGGSRGYMAYWSKGGWTFDWVTWTWTWTPPYEPIVQNVVAFSSGLDRSAINNVPESEKDVWYFDPISGMLNSAAYNHITGYEGYTVQFSKEGFLSTFGNGANSFVHTDIFDPTGGTGSQNP